MKKLFFSALFLCIALPNAFAEVSIETAVSRSSMPVGEQLVLDIIVSNADGKIESPSIHSVEGFTSYSQGHSQELSIVNGRSSSRSIFSYVLVANSAGQKTIGPFEITIAGKEYKIAPVKVEVTQAGSPSGYTWSTSPVSTPSPRAMAGPDVHDQDIFIKAWLDKDEVYVNEPATLTYTLFTRLNATYKGFEKEAVTTGFWVEDFPPEKTIRRTEQFLNGQRYVVADVRKIALFPTQSGVFTLDPGVLSATVEYRNEDSFQTFFSNNVFGARRAGFSPSFMTETVSKSLIVDPLRLVVKALPEMGKPQEFSGAVGQYEITSSIDKNQVEVGDPVTLRVKIQGQGNINTVQSPKLPQMDGFKVYDSSSSNHISKERLVVEGEKVTETVIVPRKPGTYDIPSFTFSFFEPKSGKYRTLKTESHTLNVSGVAGEEASSAITPSSLGPASPEALEPVMKEEVDFVAKDIRFIKTVDNKSLVVRTYYRKNWYWAVNFLFVILFAVFSWLGTRRTTDSMNAKGSRLRRSHAAARAKLRASAKWMKENKRDEFYTEISHAVHGYFADKFNIPEQGVSQHRIEELSSELISAELLNKIKKLFDGMSHGRFARMENDADHMRDVYDLADEVLTSFEKVKLR